jgi:hypothetical protein
MISPVVPRYIGLTKSQDIGLKPEDLLESAIPGLKSGATGRLM